MAQLEIFTGHFGSGKTEIVLNRAIACAKQGETVCLVDLDIVKPYFRSREVRHFLQECGINLITPGGDFTSADLPVISAQVLGALTSAQGKVLFDVGGDPIGAAALGMFAQAIGRQNYTMYFVLNPFRPFTQDMAWLTRLFRDIELSSRLKVTGIISNPNLGRETSLEDLRSGLALVKSMAGALGVPVVLTAVTEGYVQQLSSEIQGQVQGVKNYLLPPWELEEGQVSKFNPNLKIPQTRRDSNA